MTRGTSSPIFSGAIQAWLNALRLLIAESPYGCWVLAMVSMTIELVLPVAIVSRRLRPLLFIAAAALHIGIWLMMWDADFFVHLFVYALCCDFSSTRGGRWRRPCDSASLQYQHVRPGPREDAPPRPTGVCLFCCFYWAVVVLTFALGAECFPFASMSLYAGSRSHSDRWLDSEAWRDRVVCDRQAKGFVLRDFSRPMSPCVPSDVQQAARECLQRPLLTPSCRAGMHYPVIHRDAFKPGRAFLELTVAVLHNRSAPAARFSFGGFGLHGLGLQARAARGVPPAGSLPLPAIAEALLRVLRPAVNALFTRSFEAVAEVLARGCPSAGSAVCDAHSVPWARRSLELLNVALRSDRLVLAAASPLNSSLASSARRLHRSQLHARVEGVRVRYAFCQPPQTPPSEVCMPAYFPSMPRASMLWGDRCHRTFHMDLPLPTNSSLQFAPVADALLFYKGDTELMRYGRMQRLKTERDLALGADPQALLHQHAARTRCPLQLHPCC